MTDVLVGFLAFLLFQQATALGLVALSGRVGGRGWFLLPTLVGAAALGASLGPHLAGSLQGQGHSTSDVDAWRAGTPSPWVLGLAAAVVFRILLCTLQEIALSAHLWRISHPVAPGFDPGRLEIRIHGSESLRGPFVRGVLRPTLYLHRDLLEELPGPSLRAVCLHEARHAQRRDHLVAWLHSLVVRPVDFLCILAPFHATWRDRAEDECDDYAARGLGSRLVVAQAIVDVLRFVERRPAALLPGPGFVEGADSIRRRVQRLLSDPPGTGRSQAPALLVGALLLSAIGGSVVSGVGLEFYCLLEHVIGTHCVP